MKSMRGYFKVTFQYSESVWCTNIAKAETVEDVKAKYSKYDDVEVKSIMDYELEEAKAKGMPIITCPHIEPEPEPEQTQQPDPDKLADIRGYFESCRAYWTKNGATPAAATSRALWWDCCEVWNADKSWTPEKIEFINQYRQYKPYGPIPEEERVATGNA